MFAKKMKPAFYAILLGFMISSAQVIFGQQDPATATRPRRVSRATSVRTIPAGKEVTLTGNVTMAGENSFTVCDQEGAESIVQLTNSTRITTHRRGIFRGAKTHDKASLLVGLLVTVKGRGNEAGELMAKWVRFHDSNYKATTAVNTRAIPIERAQDRMADQLDETTFVATAAKKEARIAQEGADKAQSMAESARTEAAVAQRTATGAHAKIATIDDFETVEELVVNFKAGSAVLTEEAKTKLDEFAAMAVGAKGYAIEICAFASKEGGAAFNHQLSQERAEVVMDYLINTGKVAPRRFITPYSGGVNNPIADNSTREGRMQNRRTEVKLLVSRGLAAKEAVAASDK